jgi:uncharacterized protein DUF4180
LIGITERANLMPDELQRIHDVAVLLCAPDGLVLRSERDAMDILSEALHHGASWVVIPASRLDDGFFQLRTRLAGDVVQKFVNYRCGIAIVRDNPLHLTLRQVVALPGDEATSNDAATLAHR